MKLKIVSAISDYYREIVLAYQHFSKKERVLFLSMFSIFIISGFAIGVRVNDLFLVEVPAYAGTLSEGLIGVPRFINPVLASSDADRDLSALVYSGLVRLNVGEKKYIADIADYTISEDHLTYTFTIKDDAKFHDGSKVTSDDVIYTIKRIQDPESKSPRYPTWENIKAEKVDEQTVKITLRQANSTFLESATVGILPSKNWKNATGNAFSSSVLNLRPIGSGPYKIARVKIGSLGIAESYELSANSKFVLGAPKIQTIILNFYPSNQELFSARKNGSIKAIASISGADAGEIKKEGGTILKSETPLPRIFAVFFNQNHNELFTSSVVREALSVAIPKSEIINSVFGEFATPINGPLGSPDLKKLDTDAVIIAAKGMLERDGWKFSTADKVYKKTTTTGTGTKKKTSTITLSFTLATASNPEMKSVAELVRDSWEKMGAKVSLDVFEIGDLNQNIIRPRKYDALFFGEILGRSPDLYPFWHSSQRNDPGLNVALYTNIQADRLLEKARATINTEDREAKERETEKEILKDYPALFLYSPYFLYAIPKELRNVKIDIITVPSERFANVYEWYTETDRVWKFLVNNK